MTPLQQLVLEVVYDCNDSRDAMTPTEVFNVLGKRVRRSDIADAMQSMVHVNYCKFYPVSRYRYCISRWGTLTVEKLEQ